MTRHLLIFLSLAALASCSPSYYFNRDQAELSKELKQRTAADQAVRHYTNAINAKFGVRTPETVWDSLANEGAPMNKVNVAAIRPAMMQTAKFDAHKRKNYENEMNAGEGLMSFIDEDNAARVYEIIRKYGYISHEHSPWQKDSLKAGCSLILAHVDYTSPLGRKIAKLLIQEYRKGKIDEREMTYLIWNINYRRGTPANDIEEAIRQYISGEVPTPQVEMEMFYKTP